jgi:Domain of unknown function (DUF1830)
MKSSLPCGHLCAQTDNVGSNECLQTESFIHCRYCNDSNSPHVLRSKHLRREHLCCLIERVVMPGVCLEFDAPLESMIEVYTGEIISSVLSDTIPVKTLRVEV